MQNSRNPYQVEGQKPCVVRSIVVYMDILGYTEMAIRAEREKRPNAFLSTLYEALRQSQMTLTGNWLECPPIGDKDPYALKAFTDNIVIAWPIGIYNRDDAEAELGFSFMSLSGFQLDMTMAGFFVRGAISVGDAYVDDIAVFGSGFLEAVEAEMRLARDPRIILTDSAVNTVREHLRYYGGAKYAPQNDDLYRDADGQWFLNYLESLILIDGEGGPAYAELARHKEIVEQRLREFRSEPRIWNKYAWVANYHNYFCDEHSEHIEESYKIDLSAAQMRPTRISDGEAGSEEQS